MPLVAVADFGTGNLRSVHKAIERVADRHTRVCVTSNRSELEREALDLAIDDAKDEARRVARRFGVSLGELIDVSVDAHQVRPLMMEAMTARAADSGSDFSPGEISIQRSVRSTFALARSAAP